MDSILLFIHPNKGSCKRKVPHPSLPSRRKRTPSDSITFLPYCLCVCCFMSSMLSQSSLMLSFYMLALFVCLFVFFGLVLIKKEGKIRKI